MYRDTGSVVKIFRRSSRRIRIFTDAICITRKRFEISVYFMRDPHRILEYYIILKVDTGSGSRSKM